MSRKAMRRAPVDAATCACGCGVVLDSPRKWCSPRSRKLAELARRKRDRAERRPSHCQCGNPLPSGRLRHCSDPCAHRARDATLAGRRSNARPKVPLELAALRYRLYQRRYHGRDRTPSPWLWGAPPYAEHLPGAILPMAFARPLPWRLEIQHGRLLHGMLTAILGVDHRPLVPDWALIPMDGGCGWAAYVLRDDLVARLTRQRFLARVGEVETAVEFGVPAKRRAPVLGRRGRFRLEVTAISPVVAKRDGRYLRCQRPGAVTLRTQLREATMRGILGLPPEAAPEEAVCVKVVEAATHMRWTEAGPKLGAVPGWVGTATVECNAVAAWLLLAAGAGIGLGSKRAYGFGRVEVRANKPRATRVPPD